MRKLVIVLIVVHLITPIAALAQKTSITRVSREKKYRVTETKGIWYQGELNIGVAVSGKINTDIGLSNETNYSHPFISTIHGLHITQYGYVGLGVGLHYVPGKTKLDLLDFPRYWNTLMIPLFVNLKLCYPVNERFTPYISASFGRSICAASSYNDSDSGYEEYWETKLNGGYYGEYGIGFRYKHFNFGLGIQRQNMKTIETYGDDKSEMTAYINSFFLKIGLAF